MSEPKFCKDCTHYSMKYEHSLCSAPPHKYNAVDGKREMEFCNLRRQYGPCGEEAVMFEWAPQKAPGHRPWWRFWK